LKWRTRCENTGELNLFVHSGTGESSSFVAANASNNRIIPKCRRVCRPAIDDRDVHSLAKALKRAERLKNQLSNVKSIIANDPSEYVFDIQSPKLTISPVWAKRTASKLLAKLGTKRIFLSATLPDFVRQAEWLGIDPKSDRTKFLELGCPFPVQHRPIFIYPAGKWTYGGNPENTYRTLCPLILAILDRHKGERGLIHVSSYAQAKEIVSRCRSPRLVTHADSRERETTLAHIAATPGSVLVSPSSREGLDLKDDLSRFQIIAKIPYASLGDKRVARRIELDPAWYQLNTVQQVIQAAGRSVRHNNDTAATYVLDKGWSWFYHQTRESFPRYFTQALQPWNP
jgi:ATP-dependent DNA helicase DinG